MNKLYQHTSRWNQSWARVKTNEPPVSDEDFADVGLSLDDPDVWDIGLHYHSDDPDVSTISVGGYLVGKISLDYNFADTDGVEGGGEPNPVLGFEPTVTTIAQIRKALCLFPYELEWNFVPETGTFLASVVNNPDDVRTLDKVEEILNH